MGQARRSRVFFRFSGVKKPEWRPVCPRICRQIQSNTSKSMSAGDVIADAAFKEPAGCANSVREERGKDEGEKRDCQSNHTDRTFKGKSGTHSDPCRQADWSGVI